MYYHSQSNKTDMRNKTITIGIPAFNEQANLGYLIEDLIKQNIKGLNLEKILIVSDGSTDDTVKIINKFKFKKIQLIENKKRQGLAKTQNEIFNNSNSDIIVIVNADIMIHDPKFIIKLISPILKGRADLTSSSMKELESPIFIGRVLNMSMKFKNEIFCNYKFGNNIYTCHGTARAFSKRLYKNLTFKESVGEDAYSYLFTIFAKYRYIYVHSTSAYYRLPTNFKDHEKQSIRFLQSKKKFINEFGEKFVNENYYLPLNLIITSLIKSLAKYPLHMTLYILIYVGIKFKSKFASKISDSWDISTSSKVLRLKNL